VSGPIRPGIHPSSVISKDAEISPEAIIGPFCVVNGRTKIGAGTHLVSHVSVGSEGGIVEIGRDNWFGAGAAVGGPPQDLKYRGEPTKLVLGDRNVVRELATINIGTPAGGGITRMGNDCLIMSYAHVAHDCAIGDHVVIANSSQLAGHVIIEDHAKINGMCGFNQFVRIGAYAYIAGDSAVHKDVCPFTIAQGKYAVMRATNRVGLQRSGFAKEEIDAINRAVRILTKGGGTIEEAIERMRAECKGSPGVERFIGFMRESERGIAI
jgi:UDP-N-acetylglucosamine acyltransferase